MLFLVILFHNLIITVKFGSQKLAQTQYQCLDRGSPKEVHVVGRDEVGNTHDGWDAPMVVDEWWPIEPLPGQVVCLLPQSAKRRLNKLKSR